MFTVVLLADVARGGPGTVRVVRADIRANTAEGGYAGRLYLTGWITGADPRDAALAGRVALSVRDAADLRVDVHVTGCRARRPGDVYCVSADGRTRARMRPSRKLGENVIKLRLKQRHVEASATGLEPPAAPIVLRVGGIGFGDDAVNVLRDCHAVGTHGLRCGPSKPPNVILIVTDDQRWDSLGVMPAVQSLLAARGTTFTNAFVTTALCCPSRASMLSGLYAHNHGAVTILPPLGGAEGFVGPDVATIATWLQAAGYATGHFGKYLNVYQGLGPPYRSTWYVPPGWERWRAFVFEKYLDYELVDEHGGVTSYGSADGDYSTDVLARLARDFIAETLDAGRPFFVHFAAYAPHAGHPSNITPFPAPRHADLFSGLPPFRPPNYDEEDVSDKMSRVQVLPRVTGYYPALFDESRRLHFASLQAVDEALAAIMSDLEARGMADDTIVLYVSDNGFMWGEHRRSFAKLSGYEEAIRVPFVLRYVGVVAEAREESRFALNVDVAPTLAALAGVVPPAPLDGRSLVPLVRGDPIPGRIEALYEQWTLPGVFDLFGVRTADWKYLEDAHTGEVELYDLTADPWELTSVANDPAHAARRDALRTRALALLAAEPGEEP